MQAGVIQLHLPLDADGLHQPEIRRRVDQVLQQCCLADASLAMQDERLAPVAADVADQLSQENTLALPASQARHHASLTGARLPVSLATHAGGLAPTGSESAIP
jgi:hypothetical protein